MVISEARDRKQERKRCIKRVSDRRDLLRHFETLDLHATYMVTCAAIGAATCSVMQALVAPSNTSLPRQAAHK